METRVTGINIQSKLSVDKSGMNLTGNRWEITYRIVKESIEPNNQIEIITKPFALVDTAERIIYETDEFGNPTETIAQTIPAVTDLTDFKALITDYDSILINSEGKAVEHAELIGLFTHYVDPSDDAWEDEDTPETESVTAWEANKFVAKGMLRSSNGEVYRVTQPHTTQIGWEPENTPALWKLMPQSGGGEYPAWQQPQGSHDAYQINDKVTHNGLNWNNDAANNVYEPGVYGWTQIS